LSTLPEYLAEIQKVVERYTTAPYVRSTSLTLEPRPGNQAYVTGSVIFKDESVLYFREYVVGESDAIQKVMYSYHYQQKDDALILRYDNARHRQFEEGGEHKHIADEVVMAKSPSLSEVLLEIAARSSW